MSNVIRPTFGARPKPDDTDTPPGVASVTRHHALRVFGQAAGYHVALIHDADTRQGPVFKVLVGPGDSDEVEVVAILPDTPEGEADAEVVGMAIVRTLEVIEAAGRGR